MPKYWGKLIFAHGRFPEVGQKQKMEKEREKRERKKREKKERKKRERKKREKDRKLVITMASYALQCHLGLRTQTHLGQYIVDVTRVSICYRNELFNQ